MSQDLMFRILGDDTSHERALARSEANQRRYDVAIMRARNEMNADLAAATAKANTIRESEERSTEQLARAQREQALMVVRAQREMDTDFASRAAQQEAAMQRTIDLTDRAGTAFLGFGAVVGVGLGIAGREAMQWESSWAGVTKTVSGSDESMAQLEEGLRDLALVLPASHEEIAAVAEAAGALGVQRPNILAFTETMINLGETTNLAAGDAATALAQLMNVMNTAPEDVDRLGSTLVELGNNGASTEADIVSMAQRIAGAGATIGLTEADVLGFAAALSDVGIEAEAGGSAISKVFIDMADAVKSGGDGLSEFAAVAGVSAADFAQAFEEDPARAMQSFVEGLGQIDASGGNVFQTLEDLGLSEIRTRDALLRLSQAAAGVGESLDTANAEWETNAALVEEAAKRYETTEAKVQLAKNALSDSAITIGETLLPVLAELAETVGDLTGWFADLPGPVQTALTVLAGIAGVSAVVVGAGLKIQAAITRVNTQLAATPRLATTATIGLKALGAAAIAGGIVAVALAADQMYQSLKKATGEQLNADNLEGDLVRLGLAGEKSGDLLERFGMHMTDLGPTFRDAAQGFDLAIGSFGKDSTRRDVEDLDEALSNLVANGDIEAAAGAFAYMADVADANGVSLAELTKLFPEYQEALDRAAVDAEILAGEQEKAKDSTEDLSPAQKELADRFRLTGDEAKDAAAELEELDRQLGEIYDQVFSTEEAQDRLTQSMIDLTTEIATQNQAFADGVEGAEAFDFALQGNSEAAVRNRESLRGLVEDNLGVIETWDRSKMSSEEFSTQVEGLKDAFIRQATEAGFAREDVERYAESFDLVPTDVPTQFTQPGLPEGYASAQNLRRELEGLDGFVANSAVNVSINVGWNLPGGGGSEGGGSFEPPSGAGGRSSGSSSSAGAPLEGGRSSSAAYRGAMAGTISMPAGSGGSSDGARGAGSSSSGGAAAPPMIHLESHTHYPYRSATSDDPSRLLAKVSRLGGAGYDDGYLVKG